MSSAASPSGEGGGQARSGRCRPEEGDDARRSRPPR